ELVLRQDEILPQQRNLDRRADRRQMVEAAVEEGWFGQHRNRRGAAFVVAAGDGDRIVGCAKHSAGRRSALAFRDDVDAIRPANRFLEAARIRGPGHGPALELGGGLALLPDLYDAPGSGDDRGEQVAGGAGHAGAPAANSSAVEMETSFSSVRF